jgi:ribose transport system ATP-binding protein
VTDERHAAAARAVEMRGISKSFGRTRVLTDVDLAVEPGEVHALLGGNGAGKSTLMKILQGVHQADAGEILVEGEHVHFTSPRDARDRGIAMIFQEFSLIPTLSVAQNVVLRHEQKAAGILLDDREARVRAHRILDEIGVDIDPRSRMSDLSTAQWQLVEIAKALAQEAPVLIMDEPTASLTRTETASLFRIVAQLKNKGLAIVYISHRLEEVFEIADRITVLRDGRVVQTSPTTGIRMDELIAQMVGREIEHELQDLRPRRRDGEPLLEVRDLHAGEKVRGISFTLAAGEVLGLAGLMGSGRTELARALFGVDRIDSGEIVLHGRTLRIKRPRDAIDAGIVLVPEDRRQQGLVLDHTIKSNILLPSLRRLVHGLARPLGLGGLVDDERGEKVATELFARLEIKGGTTRTPVRLLSGGNQQKVVVAKWLATDPEVLILDEPTAGVDIGTKTELITMIRELAGRGKSIILISSESLELLAAADRILVLRDGVVRRDVDRVEIASEAALEEMLQEAA